MASKHSGDAVQRREDSPVGDTNQLRQTTSTILPSSLGGQMVAAESIASANSSPRNDDADSLSLTGNEFWETIFQQTRIQIGANDRKELDELMKNAEQISILVTGESGVGKSTLLNGLVGAEVFPTGQGTLEPVTKSVSTKKRRENGVEIVVLDTPGLKDGTGDASEDQYVQEMVDKIQANGRLDLILYCARMDREPKYEHHKAIIASLTKGLGNLKGYNEKKIGKDIWKRCLFVLTFANVHEKCLVTDLEEDCSADKATAAMDTKIKEWKDAFKRAQLECGIYVPIRIAIAGFKEHKLHKSEHWLTDLWAAAFETVSESGSLALLRISVNRIVTADHDTSTEPAADPHEHKIFLTTTSKQLKKYMAGMGAGGVAGAATGATVGATIGALAIGIVSFGPAAGVGLMLGGALGGVIGSAIAGGIVKAVQRYKTNKKSQLSASPD